MKTDDLIQMLGDDAPNTPPDRSRYWPLAIGLGLIGAMALMIVTLGPRPDLLDAMEVTAIKVAVSVGLAGLALLLITRLARPGRALGLRTWAGWALAALLAGAIMIEISDGLSAITQHGALPKCIFCVPLYALPAAGLLTWLVRGMAPTNLPLAGGAIGATAGAIGAIAYALYCPFDDNLPAVISWYVIAVGLCASAGGLLGPRVLRW